MKCIKVFLTGFIFFVLGFGVWAQDIDDEEEQQAEPAKIIKEKVVLPVQPPKPKPTPIEIQPTEPKAESKQRFAPPSLVIPPALPLSGQEREQEVTPANQFWFRQSTPVTAPGYQDSDSPTGVQFQRPASVVAPDYQRDDFSPGLQFQGPAPVDAPAYQRGDSPTGFQFQGSTPVNAPDYHNPYNPRGISSMPFKQPGLLANIPSPQPPTDYKKMRFRAPRSVTGASSIYTFAILDNFTGGLNLVDFPNKIADNEVTELVNFVWEGKKLKPRDGFTTYYDMVEFAAGKRIYGLYRYYKQDGSKILLAGASTALYADTNSSGSFVFVKTNLQEDKYYDFETFKGKTIVVHEGDYPFWYDGTTTGYIGLADSGKGALVVAGNKDSVDCISYILTGDTRIRIEPPRPPRPDEKARRRRTEPLLTIYDRFNQIYYQTDQWVGYSVNFVDTAGGNHWSYVTANANDTIYLDGWAAESTLWRGTYYIYSYFDNEYVANGYFLSIIDDCECLQRIEFAGSLDDVLDDYVPLGLIGRFKSGPSAGEEHFVYGVGPSVIDSWVGFTHSFDTLLVGTTLDSAHFYQKGFWKPGLVEIFKNRVFFANIENYENLIVFSAYNRLGDFPPDNYFLVKTQDGDKITALATFYDDQLGYKDRSRDCLVIFKENSIYKLVFNSATDYYLVQVTDNVGCVAPRSIVNVEGKYLLFLHTTGVYAFDGRTVIPVFLNIEPLLADSINQNKINLASAGYYDRHYYLSYPAGTSTENTEGIVFNVDLGSWGETDNLVGGLFAQQNAISDTVKLLFTDSRAKTFIYQFGKVETDTGQPISLILKSKAFDFNSIADRKRFTYFDLDYYLTGGDFSAYFYTDFGDSLRYNTTVSESGGYRYKRLPLDVDCLGRNFSFKITSSNYLELGKVGLKFKKIKE